MRHVIPVRQAEIQWTCWIRGVRAHIVQFVRLFVKPAAWWLLPLIAVGISACGDHVVVSPTGDIGTAAARWAEDGAASYSFVIDSTCGNGDLQGLNRVTVDGNAVTALEPLDEIAESAGAQPSAALTIDELLDEISNIRLDEVDALAANYHPQRGYPTYFSVDPDEETNGDETCYTISSVNTH